MSKPNPVGWFEIYVQDMKRARAFYEAVFETTLQQLNSPGIEMWGFAADMERHGTSGSLVRFEGMPSGQNSVIVYFSCVDCAAECARAGANGGEILREKFSIGEYGFVALVKDTEGNLIGLHSRA